jgi:hypothetical protein
MCCRFPQQTGLPPGESTRCERKNSQSVKKGLFIPSAAPPRSLFAPAVFSIGLGFAASHSPASLARERACNLYPRCNRKNS